jgi:hypothetical protein
MNDRCCEGKLRLLFEYRNAANLHSARVALMAEIASGLLPEVEFSLLNEAARQAYEKCVEAHQRFLTHMKEHGC